MALLVWKTPQEVGLQRVKIDDTHLLGSDEEESEEAKKLREERLRQYESKKDKRPALVAKSSILLDGCVRSMQADGLFWGSSRLVSVGYGILKLPIQCIVEDNKLGTEVLREQITAFEDYM
ncbi:hypothetical protein FD755_016338 [Muntiacus reevesi]|uniref:Uncharacterized protein n=1 Tax=Muntiacus reevesi TaxID=9886 RepID=A0A5N3XH22_MUNRE|nr:hypothetical protein FD755_016338 [Muntiacus reevesi]